MTNVSLSEANCMEYFMAFPWKMLQDISRGFQGTFMAVSCSISILQNPVESRARAAACGYSRHQFLLDDGGALGTHTFVQSVLRWCWEPLCPQVVGTLGLVCTCALGFGAEGKTCLESPLNVAR